MDIRGCTACFPCVAPRVKSSNVLLLNTTLLMALLQRKWQSTVPVTISIVEALVKDLLYFSKTENLKVLMDAKNFILVQCKSFFLSLSLRHN